MLGRGMEMTSVNGSHDQPVWWVEPVSLQDAKLRILYVNFDIHLVALSEIKIQCCQFPTN